MKLVIELCSIPKEIEEIYRQPAEISCKKGEGIEAEFETTIAGPNGMLYAALCQLVSESLEKMYPGDREAQKAVLEMIHEDAVHTLGIKHT